MERENRLENLSLRTFSPFDRRGNVCRQQQAADHSDTDWSTPFTRVQHPSTTIIRKDTIDTSRDTFSSRDEFLRIGRERARAFETKRNETRPLIFSIERVNSMMNDDRENGKEKKKKNEIEIPFHAKWIFSNFLSQL